MMFGLDVHDIAVMGGWQRKFFNMRVYSSGPMHYLGYIASDLDKFASSALENSRE